MFEDSTFESAGRIHTRSRGWGLAAFALNGSILAALIVIPLLYPEALPRQMMNMLLVAPPPAPAAPKPAPQEPAQVFHGRPEFTGIDLTIPRQIPHFIQMIRGPERAPGNDQIVGLDSAIGIPGGDPFRNSNSKPVVREEPRGPLPISQGVAEGMLIQRVIPRYPPIAVESRTQGTVLLQAVISKTGTIENLRVVSGNPMLQQAAMDAVSQWRYRPYLLDGQPVEAETTINVVFSLNR
jgi:periplasmic protein TonB